MKIPEIKVEYDITFGNGQHTYTINCTGTQAKACVKDGNGFAFFIPSYGIRNFIASIESQGYTKSKDFWKFSLNFYNKKKRAVAKRDGFSIYSDDSTYNTDTVVDALIAFIPDNNYFDIFGYGDAFKSDTANITLPTLINNKSNDYGNYEELISIFVKHSLNDEDFSKMEIETLALPTYIIVPSYNSSNTLNRVLFAIDNQVLPGSYWKSVNLIIIDDCSTNNIDVEELKKQCSNLVNLSVIRSNKQLFSGQSRNLGYVNIEKGCVLTLDADVLLAPNYLINHLVRMHLYTNMITLSTRENVDDSEQFSIDALKSSYSSLKPDITQDSRFKSTYPKEYIGGPGHEFTVEPFSQTRNFKDFGYGKPLVAGIELCLMVKTHNLVTRIETIRAADYSGRFFKGWGEEDGYFGRKAIAAGTFIVPVLSTGVLHFKHPPRLTSTEEEKIASLMSNIQKRRKRMNNTYSSHIV